MAEGSTVKLGQWHTFIKLGKRESRDSKGGILAPSTDPEINYLIHPDRWKCIFVVYNVKYGSIYCEDMHPTVPVYLTNFKELVGFLGRNVPGWEQDWFDPELALSHYCSDFGWVVPKLVHGLPVG